MFNVGSGLPPHAALLSLATGGQIVTHAIAAAAHLNVADALKDGPRSSEEVAETVGAHPRSVYRLLRALAAIGVLEERGEKSFSLTPMGETLRTDLPGSLSGAAKFFGAGWHAAALSDLLHCVKSGGSAFEHLYGEPIFEWLPKHPKEAKTFNEGMSGLSKADAEAIVRSYDFSNIGKIADIGGGQGYLLAALLKAHPTLTGAVFDLPPVVETAKPVLLEAGVQARAEVIGGSFFERVPAGYDAYLLKYILHDWEDDTCEAILRCCAAGLKKGGRLLVIEQILPANGEPSLSKLIDLEMLAMMSTGGERTEAEYRKLFAKAGLELSRVIRTPSPASLLEVVV